MTKEQFIDSKVEILKSKVRNSTASHYNYIRNFVVDKAKYLDAFIAGRPFPPFEVEIQVSSDCNFSCLWCIGNEMQNEDGVRGLANNIKGDKLEKIIDQIINFEINGLRIERVKFSGFVGEPLLEKEIVLRAMDRLTKAKIKVGLFTNGLLMGRDTWATLSNIDYVHISLDAGRENHFVLKERRLSNDEQNIFTNYDTIIDNIKGLNNTRKIYNSKLNITIGYIILPSNFRSLYSTAFKVKEAGADCVRVKCDIGNIHSLKNGDLIKDVFDEIRSVDAKLSDENFSIYITHDEKDLQEETFLTPDEKPLCYYHKFLITLGSNCCLYLCDHNTIPIGTSLGHIINEGLQKIWNSTKMRTVTTNCKDWCASTVCPPFGKSINTFLHDIFSYKNEYLAEYSDNSLAPEIKEHEAVEVIEEIIKQFRQYFNSLPGPIQRQNPNDPSPVQPQKNRIIKIFISCSTRMEIERREIQLHLLRKNPLFKPNHIELQPIDWTSADDAIALERKQNEYNDLIADCPICIVVFSDNAGPYTIEELKWAQERYTNNMNPRFIYTYFQQIPYDYNRRADFERLQAINDYLTEQGQFPPRYTSLDDLLLRISEEMDKIIPKISKEMTNNNQTSM